MSIHSSRASWFWLHLALVLLLALSIGGCASMVDRDPVRINVVGMEPLPGVGMEIRFGLKLRVQNPNDDAIDFDGVALELELNGKPFATGVSDAQGSVPRYGETVIVVPVTVSAISFVRQAMGMAAEGEPADSVPYVLSGKLGGGVFRGMRFRDEGKLSLPGSGVPGR